MQLEFDSIRQRDEFVEMISEPIEYITDVLVKSLQNNINKDTLWRLFGDVIYSNIKRNLDGTKICAECGERFEYNTNAKKTQSNCLKCSEKIHRKQKTDSERNRRNTKK